MALSRFRTRRRPGEGGAAAVEFAFVLPVLVLLLFGVIAFGFVFAQQISLNNAARDASRAGVVQPLNGSAQTCAQIAALARTSTLGGTVGFTSSNSTAISVSVIGPAGSCTLASGSTTASGSTAVTPCTGAVSGSQVQVTMGFLSQPPVPLGPFSSLTLRSTGRFQCEYN